MTLATKEISQEEQENLNFLKKIREVHEILLDSISYEKVQKLGGDKEKEKQYLSDEIKKIFPKTLEAGADESIFLQAVLDEMLGFGPAEQLLRDDTVTDIFINGPNEVFVEKKGKVVRSYISFIDGDHIYRLVQRIASKSGRHLDLGTPYIDSQLPDGSRLHAIIPPLAVSGIKVSIRKFFFRKLWIDTLVEGGSLTQDMAEFLKIAVQSRFNIVICGGTGSGKTTLLNGLLNSIRDGERVITLEDTPELEPSHGHVVRLITRAANPEGKGGVSQAELMINALRMRPDRVILGELRGAEAFNLLHAMNTGQDGSMVTLHASGAEEVIPRLLNMILMARYSLSAESVRQQIAGALDIIIYVSRLVDGSRHVMSISQVSTGENDTIKIEDIYRYNIEKITAEKVHGKHEKLFPQCPKGFFNKFTTSGLLNEYYDLFPKQEKEDKQEQK